MVPDSVTRAVKRISRRAEVRLHWTGHSLRIGLASTARSTPSSAALAVPGVDMAVRALSGDVPESRIRTLAPTFIDRLQ
ncbi:hypothetical protein [Streptomyces sp. NPDC056661]|uniref:hypothetical protein n=1 Tax=Streptomyces sp. NPDC056661 TaxID=3345898 RepID=UPI0036C46277